MIMKNLAPILSLLVLGSWSMKLVASFASTRVVSFSSQHQEIRYYSNNDNVVRTPIKHSSLLVLYEGKKPQYSREVLLREEAESPFRKVRFFFIATLAGGATISLLVSLARIAAGLSGINADLLPESLTNAGIDMAGLIVLGLLWRNDVQAQDSRLKRATKGAELAALRVRISKALAASWDEPESQTTTTTSNSFTTTLASLRRGRGIEKRVVIAAAGPDKIQQVVQQAQALNDSLTMNDLLIVPLVLPQAIAPANHNVDSSDFPPCLALPIGPNWQKVLEEEAQEALKQNVDIEKEGFCVVLKKNGRVGQRTRGIFLENMVGEVIKRREAGMDVKNI